MCAWRGRPADKVLISSKKPGVSPVGFAQQTKTYQGVLGRHCRPVEWTGHSLWEPRQASGDSKASKARPHSLWPLVRAGVMWAPRKVLLPYTSSIFFFAFTMLG